MTNCKSVGNCDESSDLTKKVRHFLVGLGFPEPKCECQFDSERRWRSDLFWEFSDNNTFSRYNDEIFEIPLKGIALEVEGGTGRGGRHNRSAGFAKDIEKYNTAHSQGWIVMRTTGTNLEDLAIQMFDVMKLYGVIE